MHNEPIESILRRPFEDLLASGCDSRLRIDEDGLNPYGCSPLPREAVALGSCTCSSPSAHAAHAAERCFDQLRSSKDPRQYIERALTGTRNVLREHLRLPSDVEIALTPSGTDVELLALALAAGSDDRNIVNVVVGPTEVGSGTINVAGGLHYDHCLPSGESAEKGDAIDASLSNRVTVTTIGIRDSNGTILSAAELDAHVTQVVIDAVSRGSRVLLHVVAHSKTGIFAPTWQCVDRIVRHLPDEVVVMVDAAQGRTDRSLYRSALQRGCLVSTTGSKFFGGPPFSGALLVPEPMRPTERALHKLPAAFDRYFTAAEMPESWTSIRSHLSGRLNVGAMLRWVAASHEINRYYRLSKPTRESIVREFAAAVRQTFESSDRCELVRADRYVSDDEPFQSTPTVFGLRLMNGSRSLDRSELKRIHSKLNRATNASSELNSGVVPEKFHLGQPVQIGDDSYILRIAIGSPLVVDIATNDALGDSIGDRIEWMAGCINRLRIKLNLLLSSESESTASTDRADDFIS